MPYLDGLPAAASVSVTDLIAIDQGGTANIPGTATTRKATISQFLGSVPGNTYLPLIGGTLTGPLVINSTLNVSGAASFGGAIGVTGAATLTGTLDVTGNITGPVLATGSTTPRTLQDWFATFDNLKAFGATGNGTGTGDLAAANAIIAHQTNNIGVAVIPPGAYGNLSTATPGPRTSAWIIGPNVTFTGNGTPPGAVMFAAFGGSTNHAWLTGPWGFGLTADTVAKAVSQNVTVIRNATYAGAAAGNPAAFNILNTLGTGATGGTENAMVILNTDQGSSATNSALQINTTRTGFNVSPGQIQTLTVTNKDLTTRKSSVAGAQVMGEFHLFATGPDDAGIRILQDNIINRTTSTGPDGASSAYAGIGFRGTLADAFSGTYSVLISKAIGVNTVTNGMTVAPNRTWIDLDRAISADAGVVAFGAESGVGQARTLGSTGGGSSSIIVAATVTGQAAYYPNGTVITGSGFIQAGTTVTSATVDGSFNTTLGLSLPTTGIIPTSTLLSFTNAIGTGFHSSGHFSTAAMLLESQFGTEANVLNGVNVGTGAAPGVGSLAVQNSIFAPGIQASASFVNDVAAAAGGVAVGQFYRSGSAVMIRVT